jgi:hypothetical protein
MTAYNVIGAATLVGGQPEDVSQILANFQAIAAVVNGGLDDTNIAPNANIAQSKIAGLGSGSTATIPIGSLIAGGWSAAPSGFLMCDGSAVSRATYSQLFTAIGTAYGAGDGSTTFNLPDMLGRMLVGKGSHADVSTLGNNEGSTAANRRPKHPHTNGLTLPNHGHSISDPGHGHGVSDPTHAHTVPLASATGGGTLVAKDEPAAAAIRYDFGSAAAYTNISIQANGTNISVGNPTSNPAIGGSIGAAGVAADAPAYLVVNWAIRYLP